MLNKIEKSILDEQLIKPGDRVLCAVSGGADSVALLNLLKQLADRHSFAVAAVHLDHCLRAESGADAEFVASLCGNLMVPLEVETIDIQALSAERGEGLEATGRFARRRLFERVAKEQGCTSIALAHHADDQAETVLFRLLRGSGLTGLAAMRPRSGLYIRPLLPFKKVELNNWLTNNGIDWREDASNQDPSFSRNRIRHQIMPELRQINFQVDEALCRFSQQAALDEGFWQGQVDKFLLQWMNSEQDDVLVMPIDQLQTTHQALRQRILRGMLECLRGDLRQIDAGHIDQIEALLESSKSQAETFLPGAWVARRYDVLQMQLSPPEIVDFELTILAEGSYPLPNGQHLIVTEQSATEAASDAVEFCSEQVSFPLTVRSVVPGDRFQPSGMSGHKRLKDYFIDNKVSRENRRRALVVSAGSTIIWLVGARRCQGFQPDSGKPVLQLRLEQSVFVNE